MMDFIHVYGISVGFMSAFAIGRHVFEGHRVEVLDYVAIAAIFIPVYGRTLGFW